MLILRQHVLGVGDLVITESTRIKCVSPTNLFPKGSVLLIFRRVSLQAPFLCIFLCNHDRDLDKTVELPPIHVVNTSLLAHYTNFLVFFT